MGRTVEEGRGGLENYLWKNENKTGLRREEQRWDLMDECRKC